jgi:para-nitrobenzyl esterase
MYKVQKYNVADAISVNHPVYVYQFNYAPVIFRLFGWGACHVAELPLLFGNMKPWFRMPLYLGDQTTAAAVGKRMRKYWGNFIWSGNPNYANDGDHPMDVVWSKYTSTDRNCMNFGKTDSCIKDQDVETMQKLQGERHFFVRK